MAAECDVNGKNTSKHIKNQGFHEVYDAIGVHVPTSHLIFIFGIHFEV